ncbi:Choline-sulfatase [Sulfitobacter sp. DSM 110093]|uniref:choline-sulfatase n=1 Tax=Sulfitobacter sp. DSM 110093 TaxID=2883127 RepID=UPI001FAD5EF0|nr:choline-sulfatase [Sulfitobacter sp. DSM 110093]UOA32968.1 Choline-sulfatase [Sulfitobacter sp. DSM 110093]
MTEKTNILFIQVDQLMAEALGAYGNGFCHAPNIDALAQRGAVFERAYCNYPLCAPSRASMATGKLCSNIGAWDNAAELPASAPTYAHYLRGAGYRTALAGKMHFIGPDQFHGFERRLTADVYPADFSWVPREGGMKPSETNDTRGVTASGVAERTVQMDYDDRVTYESIQYLYDMARDEKDKRPFFLQVSWTHPHDPFFCRPEHWALYEDCDIPMPRVGALSETEHDPHSARLLSNFSMLGVDFPTEDVIRARRAYYGSISYVDDKVGELMEVLEATGQADNTAIVFTSDHGEMLGERGMWFKKHFYEPSLRVPLIIAAPGYDGKRVAGVTSLVDLLPTFMGLAEGSGWTSPIEELDGDDLTPFLGDREIPEDRTVYAEYLAEATPAPILMIRRGRFKYIHSDVDPLMLFDVEADPDERQNLADDPEYTEIIEAFADEARAKWDSTAMWECIMKDRRRRLLIHEANSKGVAPNWNHGEAPGESVPWYRGHEGYNEWAFRHMPVKAAE